MKLRTVTISSPVGNWLADACPKGIHWIKLAPEVSNDNFLELGNENVKIVRDDGDKDLLGHDDGQFDAFLSWMKIYFSSSPQKQKLLPKGKSWKSPF